MYDVHNDVCVVMLLLHILIIMVMMYNCYIIICPHCYSLVVLQEQATTQRHYTTPPTRARTEEHDYDTTIYNYVCIYSATMSN